ncbi:type II toxin-antitoxin system RelE/ParE family toxin [soil metagenome]
MPNRVFLTKKFDRWAKDAGVEDQALIRAVEEIESGLVDANLGGNVYKKRVARQGEGKSGGFRTILALKADERTIFLVGFAKNERDNLTPTELSFVKALAKRFLSLVPAGMDDEERRGEVREVRRE